MGHALNAEKRTRLDTPLISLNGIVAFYTLSLECFPVASASLSDKTAHSLLSYSYVNLTNHRAETGLAVWRHHGI